MWGLLWAHFTQIWSKMNFPGKKDSVSFRHSNYLTWYQKSENTIWPFLRKTPEKNFSFLRKTDGRSDGQTETTVLDS